MSNSLQGPLPSAEARLQGPMAIISLAVIATLVAIGLSIAAEMDRSTLQREQKVVQNGVVQLIDEIARLPLPQVVWDDAVRNLDNRYDAEWAKQNIGAYLDQTNGFGGSYILNQNSRAIFAYRDHKVMPVASFEPLSPKVRTLIADVRRVEAARAVSGAPGVAKLGAPIQSSGIVGEGDNIHIVTATLVQPDFGTARISKGHAPILITDMTIDETFLARFAKRFLLEGLHVHPGDSRFEAKEAHVAMRDRQGAYVATIDWLPQQPGKNLLLQVGLPILALIILLVLCVLHFVRRGIRSAERLRDSEALTDHMIHHDELTGLPNRLSFMERLEGDIAQLRSSDLPIAVLSIDLDRFEEIGKTFGHRAAEEYVAQAALRMAEHRRPADMLARFSADEFGIIMPRANHETASRLAARLCAAVARPMELSCGEVFGGCTIGVGLVAAQDDLNATEALRHADIALHRAKKDARGHFCLFENEMDAVVKNRRLLELELRKALDEDALDLYYQPQVNRRGYVTGVEALVRWTHPERGPISPALFVPIAEECGLIMQLGMFTLRRAFRDSRRWPSLKIAVNVSAVQIMNEDFIPRLTALIAEKDVNPRRFELEITEGILINDDPDTQERLHALRKMGFALALDDFGTGYSSLSYLSRYPVNKIKIDRSFISNLGRDRGADAVVTAIIHLARALKLAVIAEGVETTGQRGQLARAGCFNIQGFLYSGAVPADKIDLIYRDNDRLIGADYAFAA